MSVGWQIFSNWVADKLTTQGPSTARTDSALRALATARRFANQGPENQSFADTVLTGLDARLRSFERAVAGFSWPSAANPFLTGRLSQPSNADRPGLAVGFYDGGNTKSSLRYFSKGFDAKQQTTLAPGTYSFQLDQASKAERLSIEVKADDKWGDVLSKTAKAINSSQLFAQSAAVYSNAPSSYDPQVTATGSLLAVKLDPARAALGDVQLTDVSGGLLKTLGLTRTRQTIGPTSTGPHSAQVQQVAKATRFTSSAFDERAATTLAVGTYDFGLAVTGQDNPTTYYSKTVDPTAVTSLAAGTHSFSMKINGETKDVSFTVTAGEQNNQVINDVYQAMSSYLPAGANVAVENANIASPVQYVSPTEGERLVVSASAGTDISLTDGATGVLSSLGLTNAVVGTPISVQVSAGDRWKEVVNTVSQAISSANAGYFSSGVGERGVTDLTTMPGKALSTAGLAMFVGIKDPKQGQGLKLNDGAGGILATLGLSSATGGVDGKMVVDGTTHTTATNTISQDSGRIQMRATAQTAPLQLSVVDALSGLENAISDLAVAYNSLKAYLISNNDRISSDVPKGLDAPLNALSSRLANLGVFRLEGKGKLVVDGSTFASSIYRDGTGSKATFFDQETGLIPSWASYAAHLRDMGLENLVKGATGLQTHQWQPKSENDLHRVSRVFELIG